MTSKNTSHETVNTESPHAISAERVASELSTTLTGLSIAEVNKRQQQYGRGGRLRVIADVTDPELIRRILAHRAQ
ncbi:MAG: cation-transporting P-type ATPase, partial [Gammaproteobacteria bacterium]|nr:cation-transporting P-type ATPase [Gammaproteobacteria bacterium]